jgi:ketol-acid reductoisomerase
MITPFATARGSLRMDTFITSFEEEAQRDLLLRMFERKVGPLTSMLQHQMSTLTADQLLALSDAFLDITNLAELTTWLANQEAGTQPVPPDADAGTATDLDDLLRSY